MIDIGSCPSCSGAHLTVECKGVEVKHQNETERPAVARCGQCGYRVTGAVVGDHFLGTYRRQQP